MIVTKKENEPYKIQKSLIIDHDLAQELKQQADVRNLSWSQLACEYILKGILKNRDQLRKDR